MYERNFSEAINIVERKLNSLAPNQPLDSFAKAFLVQMGQCQEWLGQHEAARQTFERALREIKPTPDTVVRPDANGTPSILAQAYAGLGEKEKALQQAAQAVKDYNGDAVNQPQAEVPLAQIQARFGDRGIATSPRSPGRTHGCESKIRPAVGPAAQRPAFPKALRGQMSES
jgi:tetratricopeptide (TPR) repeat protein